MSTLETTDYVNICWDKAKDYVEGVLNGSVICNKNIRLAVKRFQNDLIRNDLEYKTKEVDKVFKFFYFLYTEKDKQFELQPFQAFIILFLFGFYYKNSNVRKYLFAFLFIGRKNGKTSFSAALQLYFLMTNEYVFPESVLISGSESQSARTSLNTLKQIIVSSPALNKRLEMQANKIVFKDRNKLGWCTVVPALPDKLMGLNPTSCIIDEIHTFKDEKKFTVIKNALGTKKNPMLLLISTGGYGKNSFCQNLVEAGRNVLRGISEDDRFAYFLYEVEEGDSLEDEKVWLKANPGLGTILDYKTFKDEFNTAKTIPSTLKDFQVYHLNLFEDEHSSWIDEKKLLNCIKEFSDDDVKNLPCYIGVDLAETRDLTSISLFWDGGEKFYSKSYYFFINNGTNSLRKGGINIHQWVRENLIIQMDGDFCDFKVIKNYLFELNKKYKVRAIFYDRYHFKPILQAPLDSKGRMLYSDVNDDGIMCYAVPIGEATDDPVIRFLEGLIYNDQLNIYINKCTVWNFRNIVIKRNRLTGNMRLEKDEDSNAIDGVKSLSYAVHGYLKENSNSALIFMRSIA